MFSTLTERIRGLASLFWREVAKFGAVGGVAFVIDNGLFWYLIHGPMSDSEVKARFVSASVATVFAWIANRYWTFRRRRQPNPMRELSMFVFINLIGMGIAAGCVWIAKYPMDITDRPTLFFAGIVGTVIATVIRFVAYRFWVFNVELDEDPAFSQDRQLFGYPESGPAEGPANAPAGAAAGSTIVDHLAAAPQEPTLPRDQ